jgi:hypothetical protein
MFCPVPWCTNNAIEEEYNTAKKLREKNAVLTPQEYLTYQQNEAASGSIKSGSITGGSSVASISDESIPETPDYAAKKTFVSMTAKTEPPTPGSASSDDSIATEDVQTATDAKASPVRPRAISFDKPEKTAATTSSSGLFKPLSVLVVVLAIVLALVFGNSMSELPATATQQVSPKVAVVPETPVVKEEIASIEAIEEEVVETMEVDTEEIVYEEVETETTVQ